MTYDHLVQIARTLEGKTLQTPRGKEFKVGVYMDCPFFIPASTGQGRCDGRAATERFLQRFNATGSMKPADYRGITHSASYLVVLAEVARKAIQ